MLTATDSTRIARFGRGASIVRAYRGGALEEAQIRDAVPSIFAEGKHESRSLRYTYIPTIEVLRGLAKEGFRPYEVRQGGTKDETRRDFTKHLVRLRRDGSAPIARGDAVRELVLVNSHDGTSSYQLMAGLFRMVCSNGLVVCEPGTATLHRVPHKGDVVHEVIEGAYRVLDAGDRVEEDIRDMQSLELTSGERHAFATAALAIRYGTDEEGAVEAPITPAKVDQARRTDDSGSDLWRTFNRVQENLDKGEQHYRHRAEDGRVSNRTTRPVRSIDGNVGLNRALWVLAKEMQKLKG